MMCGCRKIFWGAPRIELYVNTPFSDYKDTSVFTPESFIYSARDLFAVEHNKSDKCRKSFPFQYILKKRKIFEKYDLRHHDHSDQGVDRCGGIIFYGPDIISICHIMVHSNAIHADLTSKLEDVLIDSNYLDI